MQRTPMTPGQRAYEAKRAAKAGLSLERWLAQKDREAATERAAAAKAAAPAAAAPARKPGLLSRLLERAQKPLG